MKQSKKSVGATPYSYITVIRKIVPLLFILFLTFIFFWKFFIKKLTPIPSDITVGMYYPWLESHWGYITGVPVKNSMLSDVVSQFWVWRNLAIDLISSGQSPLWNPFSLSGTPLAPVLHSSLFYPLNLFYLFFSRTSSMSLIVITQPLLAISFMFLLLRKYKLSHLSSLFGGVVFGFCGFMMVWLEWGTVGHTLLWLPLLLYFAECYLDSRKFIFLLLTAISLGLSFSAGHLQTFFYCFILWSTYFVYRSFAGRLTKPVWSIVIVLLLFFILFAFLIIPTAESIFLSMRSTDGYISQHNFGFIPYFNLITFFAPDFLGNPVTYNWWGKVFNYQELVAYFGLIPFVFALSSFWTKDKKTYFWKIVFTVTLLFSLKYPVGWLIYTFKIPLLSTASASRILCLNAFSGAILAAFSFENLLINKKRLSPKIFTFSWVVLLGYALPTLTSYCLATYNIKINPLEGEAGKIIATLLAQTRTGARNLILPIGIMFLFQLIIIAIQKLPDRQKIRTVLLGVIFLLTIFELYRFGWKYNPFIRSDLYFPKTEAISKLHEISGYNRIERERGELIPPNMWVPYGLYSSSGYDPVYPRNYSRFLSLLSNNKASNQGIGRYAEIDNYKSPLFDFLGIKYIITLKRDEISKINELGKTSYKFNLDKLTSVHNSGVTEILENNQALPRVFFVDKTIIIEDDLLAGDKVIEIGKDLVSTAVVSESVQGDIKVGHVNSNRKAEIANYQSGRVEIRTDTTANEFLVLTDTYYPGWQAYIDGKKTKIYRVNISFRGVVVPSGSHELLFVYQPISYIIGGLISIAGFISMFAWLFVVKIIHTNNIILFKRVTQNKIS